MSMETLYIFPGNEWKCNDLVLQIETRVEGLAGNNLDRLFDPDLDQKTGSPRNIHRRQFVAR
jgi:hypothetical protein